MPTSIGDNRVGRGSVMGGWVERVDATNTRVIVVTKRRMQTSVFTALTETTFHRRSAETVESLKAGQPLQDAPR